MGLDIFENEGTSDKGCVEIEDWLRHLFTFGIGVSRTTLEKQWKVQKVEIWWAFVQKIHPLAKTLYTEDLSNITFNYLCENSPNYLRQIWSHKSYFTMQLVCIFLAQILLHTFYKSSLSTAQIKVHQIPHFIFQIKSLFFFKVLRDNSSVLF